MINDEAYARKTDNFATREIWVEGYCALLKLATEPGQDLVDIGCSTGCGLALAKRWGLKAVGFDVNTAAVRIAQERGLDARWYDGVQTSLFTQSVDVVTVVHTLNHVGAPEQFMSEAYRILRFGGRVGVINPNLAYHRVMTPSNLITGYRSDDTIRQRFTRKSLTRLLGACGFAVEHFDYLGKPAYRFEKLSPYMLFVARKL